MNTLYLLVALFLVLGVLSYFLCPIFFKEKAREKDWEEYKRMVKENAEKRAAAEFWNKVAYLDFWYTFDGTGSKLFSHKKVKVLEDTMFAERFPWEYYFVGRGYWIRAYDANKNILPIPDHVDNKIT